MAYAIAGFFGGLCIGLLVAAVVLWHVLGEATERLWSQHSELLDRMQSSSLHEFKATGVETRVKVPREVVRDRTGLMARRAQRAEPSSEEKSA